MKGDSATLKHGNNQINQQLLPIILIPGAEAQLRYRFGLDEDPVDSACLALMW